MIQEANAGGRKAQGINNLPDRDNASHRKVADVDRVS